MYAVVFLLYSQEYLHFKLIDWPSIHIPLNQICDALKLVKFEHKYSKRSFSLLLFFKLLHFQNKFVLLSSLFLYVHRKMLWFSINSESIFGSFFLLWGKLSHISILILREKFMLINKVLVLNDPVSQLFMQTIKV